MDSKPQTAIQNIFPGTVDHGDGQVSFAIYAPDKQSVHITGSFNDWDPRQTALEQHEPGYWVTILHLDEGTYQYQFILDDNLVVCDPYAHQIAPGASDDDQPRAVIRVGAKPFLWQHDDWLRHSLRNLIIYEMHVGDFTENGTFTEAMENLDHLADLGITAIELMPIYEAAPDDYWGYQPVFLMAPRRAYGSPDELRALIDAAHGHDMAVILDMILAHTAHEHPFNRMYPYEQSPWYGSGLGQQNQYGLPMLDYLKDPTNAFVRDMQSHWLKAYHVDGFRYDYLAGIGADAEGKGLPHLMERARDIQPDAYFIGECIPEDPGLVNGSGLGAVWHTRCRLALLTLLLEREFEPYSPSDFAETVRAFDPGTQDYQTASFMVNYVECHDDERLMLGLNQGSAHEDTAWKKSALAAAVLMTLPGEPMLYQGQEWGEDTEKNQEGNKIHWDRLRTDSGKRLLTHYQRMCRLRRSRSSLRSDYFEMPLLDESKRCIVYHRLLGESDQVVVAVNFSSQAQDLSIPLPQSGYWHEPEGKPFEAPPKMDRTLEPCTCLVLLSGKS